ncbi:hypothetical protein ACSBR1_004099 [Camellia fascicularis]
MAHLGGGAKAHARVKQYEYRANSSLVLTTDSRPRDTHEPTGEPETLFGKIDPKTVGDRAHRGRSPELDEKLKKSKKKKEQEPLTSEPMPTRQSKKKRLQEEESILTSIDVGVYHPKTKETRAAYKAMLSVIQQQLGGQPLNIVSGAADEILSVLKNETLVSIGKLINDYHDAGDAGGSTAAANGGDDALDDDVGVAIEFEENEEEEEESDLDVVQEDEEDDDDLMKGHGSGAMQMGGGIDDDDTQDANEGMTLNVQDIDVYWLQRKISQAYEQQIDSQQSQKLVEEHLLRNRLKIVWCSCLARAEDEEKRKKIEEEMLGSGPELAAILEQLHATRATAKERQKNLEKSIREEARRLKDESGVDGDRERRGLAGRDADSGWLKGQRLLLDLENLAFHQALKPKPLASGEELIKISDMPDWAQRAFKGMNQLNRVQRKTNVAMLTIHQQIALHRNEDGSFNHSNYKIVYVALMKALVAEVVGNLSNRLQHYDVKVKELSGDQTLTRQEIEEIQIIVTTPEKWDIITCKSGDRAYTQLVKLLIIDEIHLLHDNRGPVRQIETTKKHIHLVGLSATLPNYEDVALFLQVDLNKGLFHLDNSYRPCPLAQQYIGIIVKKPLQGFQLMNDVCYEKVIDIAGKHQVLIFVHSRKETAKTARSIRDAALAILADF